MLRKIISHLINLYSKCITSIVSANNIANTAEISSLNSQEMGNSFQSGRLMSHGSKINGIYHYSIHFFNPWQCKSIAMGRNFMFQRKMIKMAKIRQIFQKSIFIQNEANWAQSKMRACLRNPNPINCFFYEIPLPGAPPEDL